ncbi:hypothetical protein TanjilG_10998 [Lupinus angustifolius]|uniref:Uncharacterized protein n=1 Tax=Lupinus angustifolius TaxID=3871 RepID=A0A1J7HAJ5_LUPAN|nr:hypothetical protein TanjilG_10998 [Lupinus angustifolius]
MMRGQQQQDQISRDIYQLSMLVLDLLRSPPSPLNFSDHPQITPASFASLLLGISLAMMLCGSVTFFIGFMLMPWVIGLAMLFYLAGIVSTISALGRSILSFATLPPKDIPGKTN